jgi:hypothetical protein
MGVIFDILFETLIESRIGRWVLAALIAGIAFWFAGPRSSEGWIVAGAVTGLALLAEALGFLFGRKKEKE